MDEQFLIDDTYPSNGPPPTMATYHDRWLEIPEGTDFDTWMDIYAVQDNIDSNHNWWLADCMIWGESHFGEDYAAVTGAHAEHRRDVLWVGNVFPPKERRAVSWTHHRMVRALDKPDRDRLLDEAVAENLSTRDFEQRVKAIKAPPPTPAAKAEGDDPGDEHRDSPNTAGPARPAASDTQRAIRAPFERLREDFMARSGPHGGLVHDHEDSLLWDAVLAAVDYVLVGRASAETGLRFALEQLRLQAE